VRFCQSRDGTRIAYAVSGSGLPLVRAPHWLTHLEYEWQSPVWRPWLQELVRNYRLLRIDGRGIGLSDRNPKEISLERAIEDLEAAVDAAGLERFALFGASQGGATSIEYSVRHPERVTHLVLFGTYARGWLKRGLSSQRIDELDAQLKLVEAGWGRQDPAYRHLFSTQFVPGASLEQLNSLSELQRVSASAENASRVMRSFFELDVTATAPSVRRPTLVVHAREDRRVPFEEGRLLATLVPGARLLTLETNNHILLEHEPAFRLFFSELRAFLSSQGATRTQAFADLTAREAEILERIARGLDNAQIAAQLGMSEKTVRNHITRVFYKIGVQNRSQAIVRARERGIGRE
jgi:pimeloyl-ACP methyl ester carboxylesterase/DNA-binding CsgD family transcriptional regulator